MTDGQDAVLGHNQIKVWGLGIAMMIGAAAPVVLLNDLALAGLVAPFSAYAGVVCYAALVKIGSLLLQEVDLHGR